MISTAILQIKYLNRALQYFDSTQVIPVQFVLFTLSVIIGSAILYRDFERTTTEDALKFFAGCALTFSGVWLITSGRSKMRQADEEEGSDDEDGIDLVDEEHQQPEIRERSGTEERRASLRPSSARRLRSSHSDAPSLLITSDDTQVQPFSFEDPSPLTDNPWTLPAPANISAIHPRSRSTLPQEGTLKTPPRMHATTSAPTVPTTSSLRLSPRPRTPNRATSSSSVLQDSPSDVSPSQRYRHIDPSEATPGRINTLAQMIPGPLTNPLSSSLSAIVADSLRRGLVEAPPIARRRTSGRVPRAEALEALGEGFRPDNGSAANDFGRGKRSRSATLEEVPGEEEGGA